ncbi:MAG: hypothetical protein R2875_01200 [Desulfobacterales bacterium]
MFVNSALTEPLVLHCSKPLPLAAHCGAQMTAGPQDIIKNCDCGLLVDTTDTKELVGPSKTLTDAAKWKAFSKTASYKCTGIL